MYNVQDYSVLYNNKLLVLLYDRLGFLLEALAWPHHFTKSGGVGP